MLLRTSKYYSDGQCYKNEDILCNGSKITSIVPRAAGEAANQELIDLTGLNVFPGFIDIHVHGGMGYDVMDSTYEAINGISAYGLQNGVTAFCPTTVTARPDHTDSAIDAVREAAERGVSGARIIGAFLEGPYINPKYKGAHPEEYIRGVSIDELRNMLERGGGHIKSIAIAPELPGALDAIAWLCGHGINVRLGHSAATYEQAVAGIAAGGSVAIHTYNAMSPFGHRAPGMLGAALVNGAIWNEFICDLVHTHVAAAQLLYRAKGAGRMILVTDCMNAGGLPDGDYHLGELKVIVKDGIARTETGALASSTATILQEVRKMNQDVGVPLAEAVQMATANPAKALGVFDQIGAIAAGKRADIIAVDNDFNLKFVMLGGEVKQIDKRILKQ